MLKYGEKPAEWLSCRWAGCQHQEFFVWLLTISSIVLVLFVVYLTTSFLNRRHKRPTNGRKQSQWKASNDYKAAKINAVNNINETHKYFIDTLKRLEDNLALEKNYNKERIRYNIDDIYDAVEGLRVALHNCKQFVPENQENWHAILSSLERYLADFDIVSSSLEGPFYRSYKIRFCIGATEAKKIRHEVQNLYFSDTAPVVRKLKNQMRKKPKERRASR
ncbi:MAG: hypothetical protein AAGH88_03260 [Planctomycetota bacterium]